MAAPRISAWATGPIIAVLSAWLPAASGEGRQPRGHEGPLFQTADNCLACHNGLITPSGEDVSIGAAWRASMMANSSRDPYWQASVRREILDHPTLRAEIEDECSICHMPMSTSAARRSGGHGEIFQHLARLDPLRAPQRGAPTEMDRLAADGVSCTLCHQIGRERLGDSESFTGGYVIAAPEGGVRTMAGPYAVDAGRAAIMRSATGTTPAEAAHLGQSEVCATCHTLFTNAFGPSGEVVGRLPEQTPYLEWRHSAYRGERSCQWCHMPAVDAPTPIASVLGEPREGLARHTFLGGNFFMLRMLNRFRAELGTEALPQELEAAAQATLRQLETATAVLAIERADLEPGVLGFTVSVSNLTGHKLPTGYPSRRVWLHAAVRDASGRVVFESGAMKADGSIAGNDNDADAGRFEPHYEEIRNPDEVQIYEAVMADANGAVTTGLLRATSFVKDNRLLPRGFDRTTAAPEVAVRGRAAADLDFTGGGDRVRYAIDVAEAAGPFEIEVSLRYQPIAFRWAHNLRGYDAPETRRFLAYYTSMSSGSSAVLARASARAR